MNDFFLATRLFYKPLSTYHEMSGLQLAIGCRQMLKEKKYGLPEVSLELVGDFYTILIGFTMEAAEADPYDPQGD